MSIEQIDAYIKSRCVDPRTQRDDYAGFVQDALWFSNDEARTLVGHLIDAMYAEAKPLQVAGFALRITKMIADKIMDEYGIPATEFARDQEQINRRGVLQEIADNAPRLGEIA